MNNKLELWTIYKFPSDFPNEYVARKFTVYKNNTNRTDEIIRSSKLEHVQEIMVNMNLYKIIRNENDEPHIIETWI